MSSFSTKTLVALATLTLTVFSTAETSFAQLNSAQQSCVADFNGGAAGVEKAQGTIVRKCLKHFAAGSLVAQLPEACMLSVQGSSLARAVAKTNAAASGICSTASPGFGISPPGTAIVTSAVSPVQLLHSTIGPDLDADLVPLPADARCQSGVGGVLQKCIDTRMSEYNKCVRKGMATGTITDAATLQAVCLGTGNQTQPDPTGRILSKCETKVTAAIDRFCSHVDLSQAFPACQAADAQSLGICLSRASACQVCQVANSVSSLSRDCDAFDDGDTMNGTCGDECADGIVQSGEGCDDGNTNDGDGCSHDCKVELGWGCTGQPSVCTVDCGNGVVDSGDGEECDDGNRNNGDGCSSNCKIEKCPNGVIDLGETCDDGNRNSGDGCSPTCQTEPGYQCTGQPSLCTALCGNGTFDAGELCDDGNRNSGDGCSSSCKPENGYLCTGRPSVCSPVCGDGLVRPGEGCDDGNTTAGDGCANSCQPETGYHCTGEPSVCGPTCGDGLIRTPETCDDHNTTNGDGCSSNCRVESGWSCTGQPSVCTPNCGNARLDAGEQCDDGNTVNGDGCSQCAIDPGYTCAGQPSLCFHTCGDGRVDTNLGEQCDDGGIANGDGCSASCQIEAGYSCSGEPSTCTLHCGDGQVQTGLGEQCDDSNRHSGDGCNANCQVEFGWACTGQPSHCFVTCGDGQIESNLGETCDDGNITVGDGCTGCLIDPGYYCSGAPSTCQQFGVVIDSPANGIFTQSSTATITGHYTVLPAGRASVLINGAPPNLSFNPETRTFSHQVSLNSAAIFNPVLVTVTDPVTGSDVHSRIVVIAGASVASTAFANQSVGLRLNESGLASIEPLMATLAASGLDLGTLLPPNTVLADECFISSFLGCLGSARVVISPPAPAFSSVGLTTDSRPNLVHGDISVNGLVVNVTINGSGLVPTCGLRLTADHMVLGGDYTLEPATADPSHVDVNLVSTMTVNFSAFAHTFTSGLCTAPIISSIIESLLPDIQALASNAIQGYLQDPDGPGPLKSPVAAGIESALDGVDLSGAVGEGVGLTFEAPLFEVAEDDVGITLGANSRFTASIGTGMGQCNAPAGSPHLTASYSTSGTFPTFGTTAPVGGQPYGLGIAISTTGFNQLLRGQTECGLMRTSLTSIDIDGPGGNPPAAVTSDLLSIFVPEFGQLPPGTPLRIDLAPTLAPIITGNPGPNGEVAELKIAQLAISIVQPSNGKVWLQGAFDARLGMELDFASDSSGLAITINKPAVSDVSVTVIDNPLDADEQSVQTVLPNLMAPLIPSLAGALSGFPLPQFFGLNIQGVEVSRNGQFLSLYANLVP